MSPKVNKEQSPLSRAIDRQSAAWLEANHMDIYDALEMELQDGKSVEAIQRVLWRKFGNNLREPFVVRILQAAEFMASKTIT